MTYCRLRKDGLNGVLMNNYLIWHTLVRAHGAKFVRAI